MLLGHACRGVLLSRFIEQRAKPGDPYAHVAYILTNVTRLHKGQVGNMTVLVFRHALQQLSACWFLRSRSVTGCKSTQAIVLEPGRGYLDALVSQLNAENAVRRQGCSTALRNICFGAQVGLGNTCRKT